MQAGSVMDTLKRAGISEGSEKSTHDILAERLKRRREASQTDITKMTEVEHKQLGLTFFVGPMTYEALARWNDARRFEDIQHSQANKSDEDPKDRKRSDTILLASAVYTGTGEPLGKDMAAELLSLPGGGPDLYRLLEAAAKENPPRAELVREVAMMLNKNVWDAVIWRTLFQMGLGKVLIDHVSTYANEEEKDEAKRTLLKLEEVSHVLATMFFAEEAARALDIPWREGLRMVAEFGDDEAAVEAVLQMEDARREEGPTSEV